MLNWKLISKGWMIGGYILSMYSKPKLKWGGDVFWLNVWEKRKTYIEINNVGSIVFLFCVKMWECHRTDKIQEYENMGTLSRFGYIKRLEFFYKSSLGKNMSWIIIKLSDNSVLVSLFNYTHTSFSFASKYSILRGNIEYAWNAWFAIYIWRPLTWSSRFAIHTSYSSIAVWNSYAFEFFVKGNSCC